MSGDAPHTVASPEALEVRVDRLRCVGTGLCAAAAPADLALGADGKARPLHGAAAGSPELTEAAEMCPTEAIAVYRAATGELVAPLD
ncbi:ferredoxin [Kitasatospora sp. NBC_01539]|uniref:ferredoxin n=1 Tax=Kitasatospora sp. NBC_01539 TaxID=2903577 RepID=UPI0038602DAF